MRITNRMMTNSTLNNINKNKQNLTKLEEQYDTGKKIQRPSDDPIIAVRALKLRSNLAELNQYYEKNIPDARSWMEITESALQQVTGIMTTIHTLCDQGSQDTLTPDDRNSIMETLQQYKAQIYQEGNATYAGRYVFTGYKTDRSLAFLTAQSSTRYEITEKLNFAEDVQEMKQISGAYSLDDFEAGTDMDFNAAPTLDTIHRIRLAYAKLDAADSGENPTQPELVYYDENGDEQTLDLNFVTAFGDVDDETLTSKSPDAYKPAEGTVNYIADTGELILADDVYEALQKSTGIRVKYYKTEFAVGDLRPEHYFDCTATPINSENELMEDDAVVYVKEDQAINYEVSFNQVLSINTQGSDSITHDIGREIDEILAAIENVNLTEGKIASLEKQIAITTDADDLEALNRMKDQMKTELTLRGSVMQKAFEEALDHVSAYQDKVDIAIAELGSRYARLDLTESRLSVQQDDFEDLLSTNEDADMVDTIVRFNAQQVVYNASLSAAAKVVQNTLMDFIR